MYVRLSGTNKNIRSFDDREFYYCGRVGRIKQDCYQAIVDAKAEQNGSGNVSENK